MMRGGARKSGCVFALQAGRLVTWEYDPQTNTILRSENSQDMLGVPRDDLVSAMARVHPDDRRLVDAAYRPGGALSVEAVRYDHPDGRRLWLSTRSVEMRGSDGRRSIVGVTFDITERKEAEERAWRAANRDALTGLENRASFQRSLERALARAHGDGGPVTILLVDIDDFKDVNDFPRGTTRATRCCARCRIGRAARRGGRAARALAARLGGDEFALLVEGHGMWARPWRWPTASSRPSARPSSYRDCALTCRSASASRASRTMRTTRPS